MMAWQDLSKKDQEKISQEIGDSFFETYKIVKKHYDETKTPCTQGHDQKEYYCWWCGEYEIHGKLNFSPNESIERPENLHNFRCE